jgi:hypothetical protein
MNRVGDIAEGVIRIDRHQQAVTGPVWRKGLETGQHGVIDHAESGLLART